ncbi:MAG: M14 family zinc carboxypeptidase [Bacteroidota bacterium]
MKDFRYTLATILLLAFFVGKVSAATFAENNISSPEKFYGFTPGDDRKLISYSELTDYLFLLEKESPMVKMHHAGNSPMGKPMYITFISSADNLKNLDNLKEINKELALNPNIDTDARNEMISEGKTFLLATMSMHSTEVGPSQSVPLMIYELISLRYDEIKDHLENVVLMIVPSHNPDGMDMIVENYRKYLGTPYEGSGLPRVYHKYVGHNNNRDFLSLTQEDTRVIADIYNLDWYPQVMIEKHEMGITAPRYFVPPSHDPIAEVIDEGIWNWTWVFGSNMSRDMTARGLTGITQSYLFDDYWPGSTQTSSWKNVISMLTESASAKTATPVFVEKSEIRVWGKGLSEYKKSINMPIPWEGGWWRLADIVRYEIESVFSLVKTASIYKNDILTYRNDLCIKEVNKGLTEAPYFYIIPQKQHDRGELLVLLKLLERHGIILYSMKEDVVVDGKKYYAGDFVIPLSQPFRPFIKEVMEKQVFPERHYTPGGEMIQPYDITSWSLPLHRGINSHEINNSNRSLYDIIDKLNTDKLIEKTEIPESGFLVFNVNNNESFKFAFSALSNNINVSRITESISIDEKEIPAGSFYLEKTSKNAEQLDELISELMISPVYSKQKPEAKTIELQLPRIALTETYFHDMEAGWTRFLLDQYNIPYTVIKTGEFEEVKLTKDFDVLIFPGTNKHTLLKGRRQRREEVSIPFYHPDYLKGIEKEGWKKVLEFIEQGGIVISWEQGVDLFTELMEPEDGHAFKFPVSNVADGLSKNGFKCPGSLLEININNEHPLNYGMPEKLGVFHRDAVVLSTSVPVFNMDRRILASFPERSSILSGYAKNTELLENRPASVWIKKGKGQIVLSSFNPNFRGSTPNTYKFLFNALLQQAE